MTASRTAAVAFTALTAACTTELLAPALLTTLAATCAAHEWTALQRADTDRNRR